MGNEKNGPRCTVGDDFTGTQKVLHEMIMNNELCGGYGAYKVSYADTQDPKNQSGLSFGVNQMDMSKDRDFADVFINILENAKDKNGNLIVGESTFKKIIKENNFTKTHKTPEQVFGKNLPLVNAALSSEYGINKINNTYLSELNNDMTHIDKAISLMKNPAAKAFYDNDAGRTWLYDYHNQYNLNLDGKDAKFMNDYINGEYNGKKRTDFSTNKKYAAPTDHYGVEDHVKYMHSTEQYKKTPKMVDDRLGKTFNLLEGYGLNEVIAVKKIDPMENHDKQFESDEWYTEDGFWFFHKKPVNYDPIRAHIANQSEENTDAQLSFLNLDSTYYPVSEPHSLDCHMPAPTPLINNYLEPYVMPSYTLIDFSTPSYVEPYNFSVDNYNSNNYYFDINNYQIPIDSNFGFGNSNWGGGGYFGGGYGGYGGGNYFFSMNTKESAVDTQYFKKIELPKACVLNEIIDLEILANDSLSVLLESPTTVNKMNVLDTLDTQYYNHAQETMTHDPLREFFELIPLTE